MADLDGDLTGLGRCDLHILTNHNWFPGFFQHGCTHDVSSRACKGQACNGWTLPGRRPNRQRRARFLPGIHPAPEVDQRRASGLLLRDRLRALPDR